MTSTLYASLLPHAEVVPMSDFMWSDKFGDSCIDLMAAGPMNRPNPAISTYLVCETEEQTRKAWDQLAPSGKTLLPLQEYDWGALFGWIEDRFGVSWQIIPHQLGEWMSNPQRAGRVGGLLRTMSKLDLDVLKNA